MGYTLFDRESFIRDPYPTYQALLEAEGPHWLEHLQGTSAKGIWLFSRYEDAVHIFKAHQSLSKNIQLIRSPEHRSPFDFHLLFQDGSRHAFLRQLISQAFSHSSTEQLLTYTKKALVEILDELLHQQKSELISQLAEPLPLLVMARLIGIPKSELRQIREWSVILSEGFDSIVSTPDSLAKQRAAMQAFMDHLTDLVKQLRHSPENHLAKNLIEAFDAQLISHEELLGMLSFLIFAGHETTIHLIGSTLLLILSNPNLWQQLRAQPEVIALAVEESLRFESPEQRSSFRITSEPLRIRNSVIEVGQQVGIIIGAANRDPREFQNPNVFNPTRRPNRHLAFGVGIHSCLGKLMARMQAQEVITQLAQRYPEMKLTDSQARWRRNTFFRGLEYLMVDLGTPSLKT